ncbi:hypothetical protein LR48_Vigan01g321300 [Vigna angularis]|uniref:Stigma-specific STIG1-like protein 1 n=1 Tax=Phaseolus angularis TaxID=3914 RepID=A0A0L9TTC2_PHAAN|nr:stigma-specific STIG1-like protein 1 [Vigna angularis]KOM33657.1 hypothetical protein LR48_Vigan01g321300 [Vigna angularis]
MKHFVVAMLIMALAISVSGKEAKNVKNRFLSERVVVTCDKYPNVCDIKGSAGSDCCMKKCVNLSTDGSNCGKCGKKCSYGKICCQGKCVNPKSNQKHCGKCGNKCNAESSCIYGMCSYA